MYIRADPQLFGCAILVSIVTAACKGISSGGWDHEINTMESCQCDRASLSDQLRRSYCTVWTVCATLLGRGIHRNVGVQHPMSEYL